MLVIYTKSGLICINVLLEFSLAFACLGRKYCQPLIYFGRGDDRVFCLRGSRAGTQCLQYLGGKLLGGNYLAPKRPGFGLDLAVGGDYAPVAGGTPQGAQPANDGGICCLAGADEVGFDQANFTGAGLGFGRAVEVNFEAGFTAQVAESVEAVDEFQFVIQRIETQSNFWNEIVSINQKWHGMTFF